MTEFFTYFSFLIKKKNYTLAPRAAGNDAVDVTRNPYA